MGQSALSWVAEHGYWGLFILRSIMGIFTSPYKLSRVFREIQIIGFNSMVIIAFSAFFTGMVIGLQAYYTLVNFGADSRVSQMLILSLMREFGPVLAGLLLTARAGSAMCAQIGVMRISEQIDALECMAIDVFNFLISPKLVACLISMPILAMLFTVVGVFGGYVATCLILDVDSYTFYNVMQESVKALDLNMLLVKATFFGFLIVTICTYKGYSVLKLKARGALGVSMATTQAVVFSSVSILLWDYLITSFMY